MEKVIVLSSGGIDSTTAMAIAKSKGNAIYSLSFRYGQRHSIELEAAKNVARFLGAMEHKIIDIDLRQFGGSALTDDIQVPKHGAVEEINPDEIPITYVPARNTIFLAYAMAWAEVLKATAIYMGVTAVDYSGYPDCRPNFIAAFEKMANLATRTGVTQETVLTIETPLIYLSKAEIIKAGHALGVDYALTISCYDPDGQGRSCGKCDSCLHRKKGFTQAGIPDPTPYYGLPDSARA
jgi:7-cyano-7-deazaguanine synthase